MIPLIIGGVAVGLPVGWKFARWLISEDLESDLTNIQEKWDSQLKLLEFSLSTPFLDKKIYGYYIYGLIKSNQDLLIKLSVEIESNKYINYYKNTFAEWKAVVDLLKKELSSTLDRYLVYEALFKKIFDIPYDETNFFIISEKIKPYSKLSQFQIDQLSKWIIDPIFNGWFDFEMNDIQVIKCKFDDTNEKLSWVEKFQSGGGAPSNYKCESLIIKKFTPPATKIIDNRREGPFDAVTPWVLYNAIIDKKVASQEVMNRWFGVYDAIISQMTGVNASYVSKGEKVVDDLADSSIDFYQQMKKEFRNLKNSMADTYEGATSGFDSFITAITYGGIALGGYFVYDLLTSESKK